MQDQQAKPKAKEKLAYQTRTLKAYVSPYLVMAEGPEAEAASLSATICNTTGISFKLQCESLSGIALSFSCPLADSKVAIQVRDSKPLNSLSPELLAGLALSILFSFSLIRTNGQPAAAINSLMQAAPKASLVSLLRHTKVLSKSLASELPCLAFNPDDIQVLGMEGMLENYCAIISSSISFSQAERFGLSSTSAPLRVKQQQQAPTRLAKNEITPSKVQSEKNYQVAKSNAQEAFALAESLIRSHQPALADSLAGLLKGRALLTLPKLARTRILEALRSFNDPACFELASAITLATNNKLAIDLTDLLESPFDNTEVAKIVPKRSVAEILAAKRAARGE